MTRLDPGSLRAVNAEVRHALEAHYGERLVALVLYGSYARGDAEPGSDVDLLVVLKGPVRPAEEVRRTGGALAEISLRHDVNVSCVYLEEDRFRTERSPFLLNVRREGVAA